MLQSKQSLKLSIELSCTTKYTTQSSSSDVSFFTLKYQPTWKQGLFLQAITVNRVFSRQAFTKSLAQQRNLPTPAKYLEKCLFKAQASLYHNCSSIWWTWILVFFSTLFHLKIHKALLESPSQIETDCQRFGSKFNLHDDSLIITLYWKLDFT